MYQVLIADDHPLFREAIARVIDDGFPGSTLLEASDLDSALAVAGRHDDLDLVLLDLNMPGMQGLGGLVRLRNLFPPLPAVIVSAEEEKRVILQTITYGAVGFITKSTPRKQMIQALEQVLAGSIYLPADIIRAGSGAGEESTAARRAPEDLSDVLATLTRKQLQVANSSRPCRVRKAPPRAASQRTLPTCSPPLPASSSRCSSACRGGTPTRSSPIGLTSPKAR